MSGLESPIEQLSPLKRSVLALGRMQAKLDSYEHPSAQFEDPSFAYSSLLALEEQAVLDRLHGFISDHQHLSPLKRAMLALERMQERLKQVEEMASLAQHEEKSAVTSLATAEKTQPSTLLPPFLGRTFQEQIPLSFAQQRLWFLEQMNPEKTLYNEYCAIHIQGQ